MARQISPRLQRMRWFAVVLCMIAIALNYIDRSTLAVGNLQIRESFALTAAGIGALQSAWSLTYAFAQLPIGALIDRIGTRRLVGWALVPVVAGTGSRRDFHELRRVVGLPHRPRCVRVSRIPRCGPLRIRLVPPTRSRPPDGRLYSRW